MMEKVNERARHSTELINLVQLQRQFQNLASNESSIDRKQPRLQKDSGTQTDTHINQPYIDKGKMFIKYFHNNQAIFFRFLMKTTLSQYFILFTNCT